MPARWSILGVLKDLTLNEYLFLELIHQAKGGYKLTDADLRSKNTTALIRKLQEKQLIDVGGSIRPRQFPWSPFPVLFLRGAGEEVWERFKKERLPQMLAREEIEKTKKKEES